MNAGVSANSLIRISIKQRLQMNTPILSPRPLMVFFLLCLSLLFPIKVSAASCVVPPSGLVSWWRAEASANDVLGGNNGTLQGGATFAPGKVGQAFSFSNLNAWVQVPDAANLDFAAGASLTIELWAYRTGAQTTMYLLGKRAASCGALQYELAFDPFGGLAFNAGGGSVATGVQMPLNTWMHLAATCDGSTLRFYTNGVLAASASGSLGAPNNAPLVIGNSSVCGAFFGLIDEVSLYNRALSASEIQSIYAADSAGKCFAPPVITGQPQGATVLEGENITLGFAAAGSMPLSYQWLHEGTNLANATASMLTLSNVQTNQAGNYSVLVSNLTGSALSSNAFLTVKLPVPGHVVVMDQAGLLAAISVGGNVVFDGDGTIQLTQTAAVTQNTVLDGTGHSVTISGNNAVRVFFVSNGIHFTLMNLTVANGYYRGADSGVNGGAGQSVAAGGLYNDGGTVGISNCVFTGNSAVGGNGQNHNSGADGGSASGGAIYNNAGVVSVTNSMFSSNSVTGGTGQDGPSYLQPGNGGAAFGGAIHNNGGSVSMLGSTFISNNSIGGPGSNDGLGAGKTGTSYGGALSMAGGSANITGGLFEQNAALTTPAIGGGVVGTNAATGGGGIYLGNGTLGLTGTVFTNNSAVGGGIDWYNGNAGNGTGGGLCVTGGTLNSTNCTFIGNSATGGAFGSQAGDGLGGGIYNAGSAVVINATFSGDLAVGGSGGEAYGGFGGTLNGRGKGGGIFNSNTIVVLNCTFSGNVAFGTNNSVYSSTGGDGFGGAIYSLGYCAGTNNTLYGNSALGGPGYHGTGGGKGLGGGLFNQGGLVSLDFDTIAGNSALGGVGTPNGVGVGGGVNATNGSLNLVNSIVANNPSGSDFYASFGAIADAGYNISSDYSFTFSGPGSLNGTDPLLGPLGNNGGPTQAMPLLSGSPAIDAANCATGPATDQRGVPRPSGAGCDIGAFEVAGPLTYSIGGLVSGYIPPGGVNISVGSYNTNTDARGVYLIRNLTAGVYTVTASALGMFFVPSNQTVNVGPSTNTVGFTGYRMNGFTPGVYAPPVIHLVFAGTNGQNWIVEASSNLVTWVSFSTNVVGTNGFFDFFATNNPASGKGFFRARIP